MEKSSRLYMESALENDSSGGPEIDVLVRADRNSGSRCSAAGNKIVRMAEAITLGGKEPLPDLVRPNRIAARRPIVERDMMRPGSVIASAHSIGIHQHISDFTQAIAHIVRSG